MTDDKTLSALSWVSLTTGNLLAWAQGIDLGSWATGLSAIGLVVIGGAVKTIREVGPVWEDYRALRARKRAEAAAEVERLRKGSLSDQVAVLQASVAEAKEKLEEIKVQASDDSGRHTRENQRLTKQLELAIFQHQQLIEENQELLRQLAMFNQRIEVQGHEIRQIVQEKNP